MAAIAAHDLLRVWEAGRALHPVDQALTLLAVAAPGTPATDLASLSVGDRDARLLALREETFGPLLPCQADCPRCRERLEFTLTTSGLGGDAPPPALAEHELQIGSSRLRVRLPNSHDLAAVAHCGDPARARALLARRCLLTDAGDGDLPADVVDALAAHLATSDPRAEILLDLTCPGCGHAWQLVFDVVSFLWAELTAEVRRLLYAVDALARVYSWREADILAMSPIRRQLYLEMAG
jgi:hypothetical protein